MLAPALNTSQSFASIARLLQFVEHFMFDVTHPFFFSLFPLPPDRVFAPKCHACGGAITPLDGTDETVRVVSMDKDYHVDCYTCEDCGLQLTDEPAQRCYPLDNHLLCQNCHLKRIGGH